MTDLRALDYDSLRAGIRLRLALVPVLLVLALLGWAALTLWVFTSDVVSAATLVPLIVLAGAFEAITVLQVSATRLACYLQVAHDAPWETIALSYRQRFEAIGSNAPVSALLGLATLVNFVPAAISGTFEELTGIAIAHAVVVIRIIVAGRRAVRLQTEDLERVRALLAAASSPTISSTTKSAPDE